MSDVGPAAGGVRTALLFLGTATLGESGARAMAPELRPAWPGARLAGPAVTVSCAPSDNLAVHAALSDAPTGSVLVVATSGDRERGYWGEVLTVAAQARGVEGLVIDGGVRDTDAIARRSFPVFAALAAIPGAGKTGPGSVGGSVEVAGASVAPDDWVVADADGLVVVPTARLDRVLAAGWDRAEREQGVFERLETGATTVDLLGLDVTPAERSGRSGHREREPSCWSSTVLPAGSVTQTCTTSPCLPRRYSTPAASSSAMAASRSATATQKWGPVGSTPWPAMGASTRWTWPSPAASQCPPTPGISGRANSSRPSTSA